MDTMAVIRLLLTLMLNLAVALPAGAAQFEQDEKVLCGRKGINKILRSGGTTKPIKDFCSQTVFNLDPGYDSHRHF